MAYDEKLAARVRDVLVEVPHDEKKMFGGLTFMVAGHMCCGIVGDELMLRVGKDAHADALKREHAREMDFTGRSLKGMIYVGKDGLKTKQQLARWIDLGLQFVATLPPKVS